MNNCYMNEKKVRREYFYEIPEIDEEFTAQGDRVGAFVDRMFAVLASFLQTLVLLCSKPIMRRVIRYAGVAVCFFCFLGLVGGIEQGLISIGAGIVMGLFLIFVELFCLR